MATQENGSMTVFREGQEVRLNLPHNPTAHNQVVTIYELTNYGAVVMTEFGSRRFRALFEEMVPIPSTAPGTMKVSALGYTGDICDKCQGVRCIRVGTCVRCEDCGETNGGCS